MDEFDLSRYSGCRSYQKLVDADVRFKRAFAIHAQDMPQVHKEREQIRQQCEDELAGKKPKPQMVVRRPVRPKITPPGSPPTGQKPDSAPDIATSGGSVVTGTAPADPGVAPGATGDPFAGKPRGNWLKDRKANAAPIPPAPEPPKPEPKPKKADLKETNKPADKPALPNGLKFVDPKPVPADKPKKGVKKPAEKKSSGKPVKKKVVKKAKAKKPSK